MGATDQGIFGGSRFVRWTLVPILIFSVLILPVTVTHWETRRVLTICAIEAVLLMLLGAIFAPKRFHWAGRVLCAGVFLFYFGMLLLALIDPEPPSPWASWRPKASVWHVMQFFGLIGMPCLWYAIMGRFRLRGEPARPTTAGDHKPHETG